MGNRYIQTKVIKELYARSGNCCAFPGCTCQLFSQEVNLSEICHIEGLNPDSARYNSLLTVDEANSIENLILLCPTHHTLVDGYESSYSVSDLKNMKYNHEANIAELLKSNSHTLFFRELQKIFQECRFDMIFFEQSFDSPFPEWYYEKVEEGYCRIKDLLNTEYALSLPADTRAELYSFAQLAEYVMTGVAMNTYPNGSGYAIPHYNQKDLLATGENVKILQTIYQKYRFS